MWAVIRRNPLAALLALVLHLLLAGFLIFGVDWWDAPQPIKPKAPPIQAQVIDGQKLEAEKQRQAQAEQRKLDEAKRKAEAEKRKQEQAQRRAAEEKRKAEEEQLRQEAAKRKAADRVGASTRLALPSNREVEEALLRRAAAATGPTA